MKTKIFLFMTVVLVVAVSILNWVTSVNADKSEGNGSPLTLIVGSEKESYVLGEMIRLNFDLVNKGYQPVLLGHAPNVLNGYLKIWIAFEGQEFKQYSNSSWGLLDGSGKLLQPEQSYKSDAVILWNRKPQTAHLNFEAARRASKDMVVTDYAFPIAGNYKVKAVASTPDVNTPGTWTKIESKPIQITITEPIGDDLKVWNLIKDNGDIAYLIQQNDTPTYHDEKAEKLLKEVEQIARDFPDSFLAGQMKEKLEKFRVEDAKRTEWLEKARVKPSN
ncbi:MAG: hypothetical protein ACRD6X_15815 [Pyrinomonadaceae bacterium]